MGKYARIITTTRVYLEEPNNANKNAEIREIMDANTRAGLSQLYSDRLASNMGDPIIDIVHSGAAQN